MPHYYKRRWNQSRADRYDAWGHSWWLFETDDAFWPSRQIEIYDAGPVLFYHRDRLEDAYGGLSAAALDPDEFEPFRIDRTEFEREWANHKPLNDT
ncbi:hypothetical protein HDC36_004429 [Xanthomonas sp. JAI131]|jgi:hypothetical protein|uniref:hypothetical protein n=1 Tax=Xanthomonas TaxID=338 RepID=UPI0015CD119A|nr:MULTISPECIES: hypothetical protein [Xanthomonas]MBN6110711.1 hypothetical protein [Xanthomonas bonasiae]NYF22939.1 hypothetical protein [Xanthomonas sp. JAI131]